MSPKRKSAPQPPPPGPLLLNQDIPPRVRGWVLADFSEAVVGGIQREFIDGEAWCLYLWGATGSRKTSLAAAVLKCMRTTGTAGLFVPAYRVVKKLRNVGDVQAKHELERWGGVDVLVLDDLGTHRDTPHVLEQLLFLLHRRYDYARQTILTANMSLDDVSARINPATARRLEEGLVLHLTAPKENITDGVHGQ